MTRPRRSSAELCRSKQRRWKRIWIACAMSPRVVKKTAGSREPPSAAAQMGRATAREVEGSWGIHSTLTAWSLWPSSCPRGGSPGLWGLGLPWLRGLWSPMSAAACKTLSGCRDAGMPGAGTRRPSSRPRVSGRRREDHAKEKGLVTIVNLTYIKPCVYSEDIDGRGILILPQTTHVREGPATGLWASGCLFRFQPPPCFLKSPFCFITPLSKLGRWD